MKQVVWSSVFHCCFFHTKDFSFMTKSGSDISVTWVLTTGYLGTVEQF